MPLRRLQTDERETAGGDELVKFDVDIGVTEVDAVQLRCTGLHNVVLENRKAAAASKATAGPRFTV